MKKIAFLILITLTVCSCSHRINRIGYNLKSSEYRDCDLPLKYDEKADDNYKKIGELIFGDCKNSRIKSKEQVMAVLRKEGCTIGAEFAIIETADTSQAANLCYKCRVSYYAENTQMNKYPEIHSNTDQNKTTQKRVLEIGIALLTLYILFSIIIRV